VQRPHDHEIRAEERLLNEEMYRAAREPVVDLIDRLQRAETVEDKVMLHRELLIQFGARQDATDETLPKYKEQAALEIRKLVKCEPKPIDRIREQQAILTRIEEQARVASAVQHILREVSDGLAWRALRYDRRAFTILGAGTRVGRLASGIGRDAELVAIAELWTEEQALAIHNDLTNCMRHGDLTIVREVDDAITVTLAEVKAGQGNARAQMERLDRATRLLTEGRLISAEEDTPTVHVTVVPGEYSTYLAELPALLTEAREAGFAWVRPHPCLLVGAVDYRIWGRDIPTYSALSQARRVEVGWPPDQPDTIGRTASMKRMNDRRDNFASIAPYTIFPLPAEDIADLIMGFIDILVSLDYRELERALSQDELRATVYRHPVAERLFLRADAEAAGIDIPAVEREQMMTELTSPESLLRLIRHVLAHNEAHPDEMHDRRIVVFEGESDTWEPDRAT
jgi:hypothetical protein